MLLKVYDQYKNAVGYIRKYTDLVIESELESGDKTLSFTYQVKNPKDIQNEYYIETQDDRFVVKEIGLSSDGYPEIVCQLDLETLEADMVESFSAVNVSIQEAANLALVGTGWLADTEGMDPEKLRSVATLKANPLTLLGKIRDAWMCELKYDTKNMIVYFRDQFGEDKGVFFSKSLNLRKLKLTDDSYDYYTRIVPIGEDDLRINDVNDGVGYVENYQYSNKIKTLIWEDTSYTDAEALKEDAEAKLDDMSKPAKSYSADVVALAKERPEYKILDFSLGDTITLLDQDSGVKDKQRIVKMKEYPDDPFKNTCELSNTTWTWEELQSKLQAAAAAFEDITNSDGSVNGYYVHGLTSDGVLVVEKVLNPDGTTTTEVIGSLTDNIQIIGQQSQEAYDAAVSVVGDIITISGELDVVYERVGTLEATSLTVTKADIRYAQIGDLDVVTENVENLYALYADIQSAIIDEAAIRRLILSYGFITEADIETLRATVATIQDAYITYEEVNELLANYISTEQLDAVIGNIEVLNTSVANITYLLSGEEGVGELTAIHLTAGNAIIDTAIIIDALMDDATIGTLLAGIIYTDYITIMSENGGIVISGTTMQISDENGIVRMQLGQDADGGFTFVIYDETGTGIMIDSEGIHASAVPDGLIVNDMVAEDAAIAGSKLDIQSVAECLTDDGTLQLNATQVLIDGTTLDYKLTEITQSIADIESDAVENVINFYALGGPDNPPCEPGESIINAIVGSAVIGETICGCVGWTTERLKAEEGEYLWYVQLIVYKDGSIAWTTPTLITDDYIRSTVSTAQTELQVIQGQIAAKIWESDITEATNSLGEEISEITDRYSQLVLTVDTIDERLGTLTTAMGEEFQSLYSEVTNITLQLGEIDLSVSEIYDYVDENITEITETLTQITISLEEIDLSVSSLEYDMTEYYSELSDQITEITLDLGTIDLKVSDVESKVDTSIKNATAYYAISESPTYYPTFGGDTVAIVGEAIIGKAILGNSGRWTEDQPTPDSNEYLWIRWFVEKVDGETYWTEPTLLTNDTFKKDLAELQQRYAEIAIDLNDIYLTVYSLKADSESMLEQITSINMELGSMSLMVSSLSEDLDATKLGFDAVQEQVTAINMELDSMSFTVYDSGYGMASIVMTVGDRTETADVVTNAREAFEAEDSSIEITAGTIKFLSNSLVVFSTQLTLDEDGNLIIDTPQLGIDADGNLMINTDQLSIDESGNLMINTNQLSIDDSGNLMINTTQFIIDENGAATFSGNLNAATGTFSGELEAAMGTFSGELIAATGTFSGELNAASGTFTGTITNISDDCTISITDGFLRFLYNDSRVGYIQANGSLGINIINSGTVFQLLDGTSGLSPIFYWGKSSSPPNRFADNVYINGTVYGSSDVAVKKDIKLLNSKTEDFLDKIEPIQFVYKDDKKEKLHFGVTYQNIVEALESTGIEPEQTSVILLGVDSDGSSEGLVSYTELIAPLIYEVKKLKDEISELKSQAG